MPVLVTLFLMALSWSVAEALGLLLHEMAHAVVGRLVGFRIREIRIGRGRSLLTLRIRETTLRVGRIWRGGCVQAYPPLAASRLSSFLFTAAGPLANIALLWAFLASCGSDLVPRDAFILIFPAMVCQAFLLYRTLVPADTVLYGQTLPNDGKTLLSLLKGQERHDLHWKDFYAERLQECWSGEGEPPTITAASARIVYNAYGRKQSEPGMGDREGRAALCREIRRGLHPAEEVLVLDSLATDGLCSGEAELLPELDAWSERALYLNPDRATLRGTRAAVLVQLGRYEEALALLPKADYSNRLNLVLNRIFAAQALHRQGHAAVAQRHFGQALSHYAASPTDFSDKIRRLIERTGREVGVAFSAGGVSADAAGGANPRPAAGCA